VRKLTTRERIVKAADELFYQQGFEHTSFASIAKIVSVSRGNFYHHFKTKDDILNAVIDIRMARTQAMLDRWEKQAQTPEDRIKSYIRIVITNWDKIKKFGCPVGTLSTELAKLNHDCHTEAKNVFTLFRNWLKKQFEELNCESDADEFAMHILSWSQGVATLGNAFKDKQYVEREVNKMCDWVDSCVANAK